MPPPYPLRARERGGTVAKPDAFAGAWEPPLLSGNAAAKGREGKDQRT